VKNILRYWRGTLDYGVAFFKDDDTSLKVFADVDYGRDQNTKQSVGGIVNKIGSAPIAASGKLQTTVSPSTTEAKYRVNLDVASNVKCLQR
jgi:hypothetical protein